MKKIKLKPICRTVSQTELYSDFFNIILAYVELIFLAIKLFFKETNCQKLLLIIQYSLATGNIMPIRQAFIIWQLEGHSAEISCLCHCFASEKNALFNRTANGFHNGYSRLWLIEGDTLRIECFLLHDDYAAYLFHCSILHSYKEAFPTYSQSWNCFQ